MLDHDFALIIGGQRIKTDKTFAVTNPATEEVLAEVPEIDAASVQLALDSASTAFETWSKTPLGKRREIILRYAEVLEAHRDEIIDLLIAETGKPLDNAEYDFGMLTTCLHFFCEEAARIDQQIVVDPDDRFLNYTLRQPLGVVVGYLAWNFPLLNLGYKFGPILASGCTGIVKPSQVTPLASLRCAELLSEAGVPDGVLNVFSGTDYDITGPLLESEVPSMFTMIGSTRAGVGAMKQACTNVKHFSVELGGNAPVLVYDDADVDAAAKKIVDLKFANSGQVCVSPNRCFVHQSVYEQFIEAAKKNASGIVLSAGRGEGHQMGPVLTAGARDRMLGLIESAVQGGASIVCGGKAPEPARKGYWLEPTILRDVSREMEMSCDEIFGPILGIIPFSDGDDEIALANDTQYGLAAYVFTTNLTRGLKAAKEIDSGSVCINEPHYAIHLPHGGLKQSGVGKDCSKYSLQEYMTLKRVSVLIDQ